MLNFKSRFGVVTKTFENKTKVKGLLLIKENEVIEILSDDIDGSWSNVKYKGIIGQIPKSHFKELKQKELCDVSSPAIEHVLEKIISKEDTSRAVSISIENHTNFQLDNVQWLCISGTEGQIKPSSIIEKKQIGFFCFKKSDYSMRGSVGILSYDIKTRDKKLLIIWQIPYDYNLYGNVLNSKIIEIEKDVLLSEDLFNELHQTSSYDRIELKDYFFNLKGKIGKEPKTIMRIELYSNF
eukprot:gene9913-2235_t